MSNRALSGATNLLILCILHAINIIAVYPQTVIGGVLIGMAILTVQILLMCGSEKS